MNVPKLLRRVTSKLDREGPERSPHSGPNSLGPTAVHWQGVGSCRTRFDRTRLHMMAEVRDAGGKLVAETMLPYGTEVYYSWEKFADCIVIRAVNNAGRLVLWGDDELPEIVLQIG